MLRKTFDDLRGLGLFLILLSFSGILLAAPYKWIDKSGQVHYTQVPPVDRPATEVDVAASIPAHRATSRPVARHGPDRSPQAALDAMEKEQLEKMAMIRKENCLTSKNNLMVLENNSHVREMVNGEYRVIPQDEREKRIQRLRKQIAELCQ